MWGRFGGGSWGCQHSKAHEDQGRQLHASMVSCNWKAVHILPHALSSKLCIQVDTKLLLPVLYECWISTYQAFQVIILPSCRRCFIQTLACRHSELQYGLNALLCSVHARTEALPSAKRMQGNARTVKTPQNLNLSLQSSVALASLP